MRLLITAVLDGVAIDFAVDANADARVGDLARALAVTETSLHLGRRLLEPDEPLALSAVRHGVVLGVGAPVDATTGEPDGLLEVRITSGPGAGTVARLGPGEYDIGADVHLVEPGLLSRCATLLVHRDGRAEVAPGDGTPVRLEDVELAEPVAWPPGASLSVGRTVLDLVAVRAPDASLSLNPTGATLDYNRPPRLHPPARRTTFTVPPEPQQPEKQPIPVLMILLPLVFGGVMVAVTRSASYALFMLMSPVMMLGNVASGRRTDTKRFRCERREHAERAQRIQQDALEAVRRERAARRRDAPDPAEVLMTAVGPRSRLWERRRTDHDFLTARIGTADQPSDVTVDGQPLTVTDVPVVVDLAAAGVTGVAGPTDERLGLARWILAQTVVLQSPRDVDVVLLTDRERVGDWSWGRWIPQVRVGIDEESTRRRIAELLAELGARDHEGDSFRPMLVVLDEARRLRLLPGVPDLLQRGPRVGMSFLCLDADQRLLPEECTAVCDGVSLRASGRSTVEGIRADLVGVPWAELVARSLAPVRDVSELDAGDSLPASSRLLDVVGLDPPTVDRVLERWSRSGRTTRAVIGEGPDGPLAVDLVRHGPHALVAGTTGSGKSELLQTIIASLAVDNRPDEMSFVLVDYKGGAAFKDCRHLPHTVGMVTDLDGHLTTRALESLGAELRRRERRLAVAGAKDVQEYLATRTPDDEPMPRLLIVIDEFATLVAELPDFVSGLVDIARRGRSLGVHLILATQRPAGVVSAEIKANTTLRIALRVTDPGDSSDVIEANDAAQIAASIPGRAYARLGASTLIPFQASRVGGRPRRTGSDAITVRPLELASPGSPDATVQTEDDVSVPTDLAALVAAARQASERSGIVAPPSPWLPPLPDVVTLSDLPEPDPLVLPFGLVDVPSEQRRDVATFDLGHGGHLAVVGAPRAGRSTVLRALAGAVGTYTSPADVHVYAVDCGNNALLPLVALPHVGAVVTRDQRDRMERLLSRLQDVVAERQQALAIGGYADVREQRLRAAPEDRLPYLLVLLNRWEGLVQAYDDVDGGRLVTGWQQVFQEGAAVGITIVVTGDRSLTLGRMSTLVDDTLMLRMGDASDFQTVGLTARQVPARLVDGRGFRAAGSRETQVALLDADPSGTAQVRALQAIGRAARERYPGLERRPFRLDVLPTRIDLAGAAGLPHERWSGSTLVLAVGGDTLALRTLDAVEHGPGLLVTGARRSGRSTALRTMATYALDAGWQVVVVTPRVSPLRDLAGREGVHGPFDESSHGLAELLCALREGASPSLTLVDDLELVGADGWLPELLGDHLDRIRDTGSVLVGAGPPERARRPLPRPGRRPEALRVRPHARATDDWRRRPLRRPPRPLRDRPAAPARRRLPVARRQH